MVTIMSEAEITLLDPQYLNEILSYKPKQAKLHSRLADYLQVLQQPNPAQSLESMVREDIHTQPRDFTEIAWGLYLNLSVAQNQPDISDYEFSPQEKTKLKDYATAISKN